MFSANKGILGDSLTAQSLEALAESARGLPAPWELPGGSIAISNDVTAIGVIGAGLVDSVNPCAFAVIIFLITYLSYMKKSKSEIALVGFLYTLAVFVTYFAIGMGLYAVLDLTESVSVLLKRILYWAMAVMLAVAAVVSIVDGIRCLQGRPEEMKLKLPEAIRNKIKLLITRRARLGLTVAATLVLGAVVAFLEFPCTGGIYGPTIAALVQLKPEGWVMFGWLLIYNFCFILPLIVIFVVIYAGVSSETLVRVFQRHMATIKFAMAVVFVGLFVVLLVLMP